jgi:hypothetical protein
MGAMTLHTSIGELIAAADYTTRAQRHRPSDSEQLATEVHRLHSTGLTAQDIGFALRLAPDAVVNILAGQRQHAPASSP